MELSRDELLLLLEALDKKMWSLTHLGMAPNNPRFVDFQRLHDRILGRIREIDEHHSVTT